MIGINATIPTIIPLAILLRDKYHSSRHSIQLDMGDTAVRLKIIHIDAIQTVVGGEIEVGTIRERCAIIWNIRILLSLHRLSCKGHRGHHAQHQYKYQHKAENAVC